MAKSSTSFKKGDRAAAGCKTNGAPRKYDLLQEAAELLEWSKQDNALRLYDFTNDKDYPTQRLEAFAKQEPIFLDALIIAKNRLANRREQHANDNMLSPAVYNKTSHIYDHEMRYTDEDIKDRDFKRRLKLMEKELEKKASMEIGKGMPPNDTSLTDLLAAIRLLKDKS